ncbi:MucBP domain-containing protein (plasmid) [Clostridium botulinum]|uniref:MucBP domain-containing protein n=1 Tax=Clostridium botulinum TaxID=1491 RepID=UPI002247605B|nr:leucine-rich repeat domain-containing protein [Clostridium botulinum]UZP05185.1 MucBP domain-containing protein [Clostridium botulinum]UZP08573.1 MucBP domain-containing protein [Clostridium botulinum]UZP11929.1 MucBP domain-containing protein [Clostridium botulinum]
MKIFKIIAITATITTIIQINNMIPTLAADTEIGGILNNVTTGSAVTINLKSTDKTDTDSTVAGDKVIEIKDSTLESIIRDQIGKESGDITKKDMLDVRSFNISDKVIHSLSGLEYATNIGGITAENCTIEGDMSPLSAIDKFCYISFHNCNIDSFYGLPTNLTSFTLYRCNIKDGKLPLEGQSKLRSLTVVGCDISDISSLKDSINLKHVSLSENNITDITVLNNLTQITDLELFKNHVSDITPIKNLTNLINLWLEHNDITDITPLASLNKLEYLNLANDNLYTPDNKITDITPLKGTVSNMQSLYLYLNKIPTYEALDRIPDTASIHGTAWLTVRYVDENNQDISDPLTRNINFTDNINFKITKDYSDRCTATARNINGYTLNDDSSKSAEFDKNSLMKILIFHYKKDGTTVPSTVKGSTTIQYKNQDTGELLETETLHSDLSLGTYTENAKSFEGYELNDDNSKTVTLTESNPNQTIIFNYKRKETTKDPHKKPSHKSSEVIKGSYKVKHINELEELLEAETLHSDLSLGTYAESAKSFEGYELNDSNRKTVTLTKDNRNETVIFNYKKVVKENLIKEQVIKGLYKVRYVNESGELLEAETVHSDLSLGTYTENAKEFLGYELNDDSTKSITLTKSNKEQVIEFKYKKIPEVTMLPQTGDTSKSGNVTTMLLLTFLSSVLFMLRNKRHN